MSIDSSSFSVAAATTSARPHDVSIGGIARSVVIVGMFMAAMLWSVLVRAQATPTVTVGSFVSPSTASPGQTIDWSASVTNGGAAVQAGVVQVRIEDAAGVIRASVCGTIGANSVETCQTDLAPGQSVAWAAHWQTVSLPVGHYTARLVVVKPGTVNRSNPKGEILASTSAGFDISAASLLGGSLIVDPPVTLPNSSSGVNISALVANSGNAALPAGTVTVRVTNKTTHALVKTAQASVPALTPNQTFLARFGSYDSLPAAEYVVELRSDNAAVPGLLTASLYVGDAAHGTMTAIPSTVGQGDQPSGMRIDVSALDYPMGQVPDPNLARVRVAVGKAAAYVSQSSTSFEHANQCLGCHVQFQALYGLGSSLNKADFDTTALRMNAASVALHQSTDYGINVPGNSLALTSSLGLWALNTLPNREATFPIRFDAAMTAYGYRSSDADGSARYFSASSGWWVIPTANALAIQGIAGVLKDAALPNNATIRRYSTVHKTSTPRGMTLTTLRFAPDGNGYVVNSSGATYVFDPDRNTTTLVRSGPGAGVVNGAAMDAAGVMYYAVSNGGGHLVKQSSSGIVWDVRTGDAGLSDVGLAPDGDLIAADTNGQIYAVTPAGTVTSLARLRPGTNHLVVDAQGGIHVAAPDGIWVGTKTTPFNLLLDSNANSSRSITDLAVDDEGTTWIVTNSGSWPAVTRLDKTGWLSLGTSTFTAYPPRIAVRGKRVFFIAYQSDTIDEVLSSDEAVTGLANLRSSLGAVSKYLMKSGVGTTATSSIGQDALQLIGLAEALPYVDDAALAATMRDRITALEAAMRARQRPDGSFPDPNSKSNPAATAFVGMALEYTHPSQSDPAIRKLIDYLLTAQSTDGGWDIPTASPYGSTRLGNTALVMAYLPKAFDRLAGIDVGLTLTMPANVMMTNPSMAPTSTVPNADGTVTYTFSFGRVRSAVTSFGANLTLLGLKPTEVRPIAADARLTFKNGFTGEQMSASIDIATVTATGTLDLPICR